MTDHRIEGILFDCDGVLVDSLEAAARAWDAWSLSYAPDYDFRTMIEHGVRAADTVATLVHADQFTRAVRDLEIEELNTVEGTVAIPGAVALTTSLGTLPWAVVTSGTRRLAHARLRAANIPCPRGVVAAEDVHQGKPAPEPYLKGAELLGVPPDRCAVFEDAPAGIAAARAAGAGLVVGVGLAAAAAGPDITIPDLTAARYQDSLLSLTRNLSG
ncbi:HAD-IA family hydrolase [Kocuria sp. CPCC 205261]|uniref:HAD-IA family hydrolase n=1 Tax=Kocuria sp. CPCC 205261 TaxID=3073554 RepID=UPI0034D70670